MRTILMVGLLLAGCGVSGPACIDDEISECPAGMLVRCHGYGELRCVDGEVFYDGPEAICWDGDAMCSGGVGQPVCVPDPCLE